MILFKLAHLFMLQKKYLYFEASASLLACWPCSTGLCNTIENTNLTFSFDTFEMPGLYGL